MPVTASLTGQVGGQTLGGVMSTVPFALSLVDQDDHFQTTVTVVASDVDKLICLPTGQGPAGSKQTLFLLTTDEDVQIKLNAVADLTFVLEAGGQFILGGLPEISQVELTGVATSVAKVTIVKWIGTSTLPEPVATPGSPVSIPHTLDNFTATIGQTAFTLSKTPTQATTLLLFVEGVMYSVAGAFITVAGTTVTWLDIPFTMPAGARVEAYYQ